MARNDAVQSVTGEIFREGWSRVRGSMQGLHAKKPQMIRAAKGHRAAVFKAIRSGGTHTKAELSNQLEYLTTKSSHIVDSRGVLDGKKTLSSDEIKGLTDRFSSRWDDRFRPKMGHTTHMLMSYPQGTSGEDVRDVTAAVCREHFQNDDRNFDYIIAVHEDRDHPHAHIVLNRRSQEGEYFYLGRDHHFNYDDFRLSMVEHAEKVGVRLEATRRLDRGDATYAPRTKEIYDAKAEGREPVQRERVGRDLDRALAEIATTSKVYLSLSAEATSDNREDISNALFRAGEVLARGGQLQTDGDVYMENQQSFDDLKTSLTDRLNRIESQIQSASEADRPRMEKQLDSALQPVAHLNPVGTASSKLTTAPSDTGVYSETNINKDGVGAMREPETRAQIETALRGTGISSEAVIARVEQGANNASLEQRWIADDLTKIADTEGLNLERKADLEVAAEKLDQAHVRLGEALQRAEVIKDDGVVLDDGDAEFDAMRENAATETYREAASERLATESGIDRAEATGIAEADRQEAVTDAFNQNMKAMERAGMPASVIGGYTVQMMERAEERIADNPELIQMTREDRREFERLEENLVHTQEFSDGDNDQALQQDRQAEFDAFAAKSPAHAQLASRAWDKLGDDMEKPATYVQADQNNALRADMSDREIVADIDRGVREQFDGRADEYSRFEALSVERSQAGGVVNGAAMGAAFTTLAESRNDADVTTADQRRIDAYLRDTADRYGEQMRDGLARDNQPETDRLNDPDYERDAVQAREFSDARVREFDNAIRPYRTDQAETAEMRRVIEHERTEKIEGPFDGDVDSQTFRDQIERELDDEQLEALRNGDADALENVIDERLDRLYAAKAYLQSDAETANSEATREVVSEIAEEEFDAQRLKTVRVDTEKGQTHG
ncbi:Relaxase/Mobilisation nuclease domain-containing protein [Roseovarius lutimaris]|uniref:Relaxase/Mobilisation nuclease domain-containing protein n=1 Tax=Roseovarius lutimaris TaxID=1005928 RepID=A0A1I5FR10_9RHOB|nr:relaxase/mobilization nuclease domain-containing protein [Roseovarius lutimaris]SFO26204.1 Relaxase/Mobilisation nuclease domain-containing protein [Roseovarius lutimaris]